MAYQPLRQRDPLLDTGTQAALERRGRELLGLGLLALAVMLGLALASYVPDDPGQLVCITTVGSSCVMMDQSFPAGQFCNCPGPFGSRLDGYTQRVNGNTAAGAQPQQPSIATQCVTYVGSCFLANQVLVGSPCYCPSAFGPVQGISQ